MVSAIRAVTHTQGAATFAGRISFSALMVALSVSTAQGSTQGTVSESRVFAASGGNASAGEIEYSFDTALNKTSARFRTSLASGNFFSRLFSGSHDVHALVAVYECGGRACVDPPDAVRLSLISDEFRQAPFGDRPSLGSVRILVITVGDTVVRFPLAIAQRTELWSAHGKNVYGTVAGLDFDFSENVMSGLREFAAEISPSAAARTINSCRNR